MSRKKFIESHGATCVNFNWSWSFISRETKTIIFGAWDKHTKGDRAEIFGENWQFDEKGHKRKAFRQSREHIRLLEEEGYQLQTFPLIYSDEKKQRDGSGPSVIGKFVPLLTPKKLLRAGGTWYAVDLAFTQDFPEQIAMPETYVEGATVNISINAYERNPLARRACIDHWGCACVVCGFDFGAQFGSIGDGFIHVHHLLPLSEIKAQYTVDPINDLRPVCPNCHAMLHKGQPVLGIDELKAIRSHNAVGSSVEAPIPV
jgi:5-methylcytosine-specific restriction protein A